MLKLIIMRLYECLLFKTNKYAHVPQTERETQRERERDVARVYCVC